MLPTYPLRYTLCFLTRGDQVLMLHRRNPPNQGLWNGVGGRIEAGELPRDSILREVWEETGCRLSTAHFAGLLTWEGFETPPGGLVIYTAAVCEADLPPALLSDLPVLTDEGDLAWKSRDWVCSAPQVVSNIHVFGPAVLAGAEPQWYHFTYCNGAIASRDVRPLPSSAAL